MVRKNIAIIKIMKDFFSPLRDREKSDDSSIFYPKLRILEIKEILNFQLNTFRLGKPKRKKLFFHSLVTFESKTCKPEQSEEEKTLKQSKKKRKEKMSFCPSILATRTEFIGLISESQLE